MSSQGILADFAPSTPPLVPPLVIQCVNQVERRGLKEVSALGGQQWGSERLVELLFYYVLDLFSPLSLSLIPIKPNFHSTLFFLSCLLFTELLWFSS